MTAPPRVQPSSAHTTLSTPAFPELRAWAVAGCLDLDLLLGRDVFSMRGVSLAAATQMFSAQVRDGALWASTRSLRDAARAVHSDLPCLSLRPDHGGLGCRFVLGLEGQGQAVELDAKSWAEALALFACAMEIRVKWRTAQWMIWVSRDANIFQGVTLNRRYTPLLCIVPLLAHLP